MASDSGNLVTATTVIETQTTSEHVATRTPTVFGVSTIATTIDGAVVDTVTSFPTGLELVFYSTTEVLNIYVTSQTTVTSSFEIPSPSATGPLEQQETSTSTDTQSSEAVSTFSAAAPLDTATVEGPSIYGQSSNSGLSREAKIGIGVGAPLGVIALLTFFLVFFRWKQKHDARARSSPSSYDPEESSLSRSTPPVLPETRNAEAIAHPAYDASNQRFRHPSDMSGSTYHRPQDDQPLYLGIPSHMSGAKRWSKEKTEDG